MVLYQLLCCSPVSFHPLNSSLLRARTRACSRQDLDRRALATRNSRAASNKRTPRFSRPGSTQEFLRHPEQLLSDRGALYPLSGHKNSVRRTGLDNNARSSYLYCTHIDVNVDVLSGRSGVERKVPLLSEAGTPPWFAPWTWLTAPRKATNLIARKVTRVSHTLVRDARHFF